MTVRPTTFAATVAALLVAGAGGAPSATRPAPTTLATDSGPIHAFAQDSGAIAWIGGGFSVHVRRLAASHGSVVGSALQEGGPQKVVGRPLALAGTTALWTSYNGGNTLEVAIHSGSPTQRARLIYVLDHMPGPAEGSYLRPSPGTDRRWSSVASTGLRPRVRLPAHRRHGRGQACRHERERGEWTAGTVPACHLERAHRARACEDAPLLPRHRPAEAAEYAPVQVYGSDGHLMASFLANGTPRAIALAWPKLALLFELVDGVGGSSCEMRAPAATGMSGARPPSQGCRQLLAEWPSGRRAPSMRWAARSICSGRNTRRPRRPCRPCAGRAVAAGLPGCVWGERARPRTHQDRDVALSAAVRMRRIFPLASLARAPAARRGERGGRRAARPPHLLRARRRQELHAVVLRQPEPLRLRLGPGDDRHQHVLESERDREGRPSRASRGHVRPVRRRLGRRSDARAGRPRSASAPSICRAASGRSSPPILRATPATPAQRACTVRCGSGERAPPTASFASPCRCTSTPRVETPQGGCSSASARPSGESPGGRQRRSSGS